MPTTTQPGTTDTALWLLADSCRRQLLNYLREVDRREVELTELARSLRDDAGGEAPVVEGRPAATDVALELRHTHLPKLAAADVIEYDDRRGTVTYRHPEHIDRLLRFIDTELDGS